MIAIVDYGLGNLSAFVNMYKRMNIHAQRVCTAQELQQGFSHFILPGVGAFDHAMQLFNTSGMRAPLEDLVHSGKAAVLGVCVGMQILANASDEGQEAGLGWVPGHVRAFAHQPKLAALPLPHMGWNDAKIDPAALHSSAVQGGPALLSRLEDNRFYFLHSYYFAEADPKHAIAHAHYGVDFACVVQNGHVYGAQFHPEKSHHWGAQLLKNFAQLAL